MTRSKEQPNNFGTVLIIGLLVVGFLYLKQDFQLPIPNIINVKPNIEGCWLLRVYPEQSTSAEVQKILNDNEFWMGLKEKGMGGYLDVNSDLDSAKNLIQKAGIPAPFVMLTSKDKKSMQWAIPFPRDDTEPIKRKLGL
jgi:hypothetical protein